MRVFAVLILSALLAGCNPTAQPQGQQGDAGEPDKAATLELTGQGLSVTGPLGTTLAFGSPREAAEAETARIAGLAEGRTENNECGAGPMKFTAYPGGLTLNFQDGKLVGWYLVGATSSPELTAAGIGIGSSKEKVDRLIAPQMIEDSTLGEEFYSDGSGIGGVYENDKVASLYAGTNCFFR